MLHRRRRALEALREFGAEAPCFLAGDFNQSLSFDRGNGLGRHFASIPKFCDEQGLKSVWHRATGEQHGQESDATFYQNRNQTHSFHIDFIFASGRDPIKNVSIRCFPDYHVPLMAAFDPANRAP
jgi:endonuclease/exonuclease/phosphatase family metal-dependent hydrolase